MSGTTRKPSAMGSFIGCFEVRLLDLGYTPSMVRNMLKEVGQLGRWMSAKGLDASKLNNSSILEFVGAARNNDQRRTPTVRSFGPLLDFLASTEVLAAVDLVTPTPVETLIIEYRR